MALADTPCLASHDNEEVSVESAAHYSAAVRAALITELCKSTNSYASHLCGKTRRLFCQLVPTKLLKRCLLIRLSSI